MIVTIEEYKGNKIIVLREHEDEERPFSFGLSKARKILECIPQIREFYEKYKKEN